MYLTFIFKIAWKSKGPPFGKVVFFLNEHHNLLEILEPSLALKIPLMSNSIDLEFQVPMMALNSLADDLARDQKYSCNL